MSSSTSTACCVMAASSAPGGRSRCFSVYELLRRRHSDARSGGGDGRLSGTAPSRKSPELQTRRGEKEREKREKRERRIRRVNIDQVRVMDNRQSVPAGEAHNGDAAVIRNNGRTSRA